jgi:hypothetical protein
LPQGQPASSSARAIQNPDNYVEIVIHVNMLKEGWDVSNIYTIAPLRSSASEILTEQTIEFFKKSFFFLIIPKKSLFLCFYDVCLTIFWNDCLVIHDIPSKASLVFFMPKKYAYKAKK